MVALPDRKKLDLAFDIFPGSGERYIERRQATIRRSFATLIPRFTVCDRPGAAFDCAGDLIESLELDVARFDLTLGGNSLAYARNTLSRSYPRWFFNAISMQRDSAAPLKSFSRKQMAS
jgi:hypothetical protein